MDTLYKVIKDIFLQCSLPLSLYVEGKHMTTVNMQGIGNGVPTRIQWNNPATLSVHYLAHSLNLIQEDNFNYWEML